MKHTTKFRIPSRSVGLPFLVTVAAVSALFVGQLSAGLLNINFMDTASGLNPDGPGALGAGTWNRILDTNAGSTNNLFDSASNTTTASLSLSGGTIVGVTQGNGNPVQNDSWQNTGGAVVTVTGLVPGQVYKVVVYSDRIGSGGASDTHVVNGLGRSLPNPGATATALPGTANVDYAIFEINSTGGGQILLTLPTGGGAVAGMQIQGVLNGETGPQADCRVAKKPNSLGGKGNAVYELNNSKKQTLSRKVKGSKRAKYYVNVENDGSEIDNFYLMGFWRKGHFKKLKVNDRATGANITASVRRQNHRFVLDAGETKSFFVKAKRSKKRNKKTSLQICSSPSTLVAAQQDCVTCLIK